jgi:hypothetical protein
MLSETASFKKMAQMSSKWAFFPLGLQFSEWKLFSLYTNCHPKPLRRALDVLWLPEQSEWWLGRGSSRQVTTRTLAFFPSTQDAVSVQEAVLGSLCSHRLLIKALLSQKHLQKLLFFFLTHI